MTEDSARQMVREFVEPHLHGRDIADDTDIFATGLVNSLFAMQLAVFLERKLGVRLASDDMNMENFRTVTGLAALVVRKAPDA